MHIPNPKRKLTVLHHVIPNLVPTRQGREFRTGKVRDGREVEAVEGEGGEIEEPDREDESEETHGFDWRDGYWGDVWKEEVENEAGKPVNVKSREARAFLFQTTLVNSSKLLPLYCPSWELLYTHQTTPNAYLTHYDVR